MATRKRSAKAPASMTLTPQQEALLKKREAVFRQIYAARNMKNKAKAELTRIDAALIRKGAVTLGEGMGNCW